MNEALRINDILKDPRQSEKNFQRIRGRQVPQILLFDGKAQSVIPTADHWAQINRDSFSPSVSFLTIARQDKDPSREDGAKVEVPPRTFTPVQFVNNQGQVFSEVAWKGKLALLTVSPKGQFNIEYFNVAEQENAQSKHFLTQGWIMTWFSFETHKNASFVEYEQPGFQDGDLLEVPPHAPEYMGTPIPQTFWDTIQKLKEGTQEFPALS